MEYAVVEGTNRDTSWNDKRRAYNKEFEPYRVLAVSSDRDYLKRVKDRAMKNQQGTPRRERYNYKIVKDSVYPELVERFLVNKYVQTISEDIRYTWKDPQEAEAVVSAWTSLARKIPSSEVTEIDLDDFDVEVNASEGISMSTSSSTWSWVATGTIAGHEVRGVQIGDTRRV